MAWATRHRREGGPVHKVVCHNEVPGLEAARHDTVRDHACWCKPQVYVVRFWRPERRP